jgi:hypothetical protein
VSEHSLADDGGAEPGLLGVLEPAPANEAAPTEKAGTEFAVDSHSESVSFDWTPGPPKMSEDSDAPSTQPTVEETATAEAAPAVVAPPAEPSVAARVERAEAAYAPPAAPEAPAPASATVETDTQAAPPPAEPVDETPRPRRTGWWQRARASIVGD